MWEKSRCEKMENNDFAFEFQNVGSTPLQLESPRINGPPWKKDRWAAQSAPNHKCFIKVLVTGSKLDPVIYVKSIRKAPSQKDVSYGYRAAQSSVIPSATKRGVVCLEYRCGEGLSQNYETHLEFLTLTGK